MVIFRSGKLVAFGIIAGLSGCEVKQDKTPYSQPVEERYSENRIEKPADRTNNYMPSGDNDKIPADSVKADEKTQTEQSIAEGRTGRYNHKRKSKELARSGKAADFSSQFELSVWEGGKGTNIPFHSYEFPPCTEFSNPDNTEEAKRRSCIWIVYTPRVDAYVFYDKKWGEGNGLYKSDKLMLGLRRFDTAIINRLEDIFIDGDSLEGPIQPSDDTEESLDVRMFVEDLKRGGNGNVAKARYSVAAVIIKAE